jgi:hypothetical protein
MTKPTGNPRGRPKVKEYVSVTARMDIALADQLKTYAKRKRQSLSDVVRDGLQVLFSEQDPWHPLMADTHGETAMELLSDKNKAAIAILEVDTRSEREYLSDTKEDEDDILSDTKEDILSDTKRAEVIMSDTKAAPTHIVSDTKEDESDYNATIYVLGKLCPRQHGYRGTGKSLLRLSDHHCLACDRLKSAAKREAKRQAAV